MTDDVFGDPGKPKSKPDLTAILRDLTHEDGAYCPIPLTLPT